MGTGYFYDRWSVKLKCFPFEFVCVTDLVFDVWSLLNALSKFKYVFKFLNILMTYEGHIALQMTKTQFYFLFLVVDIKKSLNIFYRMKLFLFCFLLSIYSHCIYWYKLILLPSEFVVFHSFPFCYCTKKEYRTDSLTLSTQIFIKYSASEVTSQALTPLSFF